MPLYTVLAPPPRGNETAPDPLRFVFVKDGFAWPALIVPELWLLFRKMWIVFLLYLAVGLGVAYLASRHGGPLPWVALAFVHVWFALEANQFRRFSLARRGYDFVGVVEGRRREAELRFFHQWQPPEMPAAATLSEPPPAVSEGGTVAAPPSVPVVPARPSAEAGEVVGLFPAPEAKP
jgi:hypothetical protein